MNKQEEIIEELKNLILAAVDDIASETDFITTLKNKVASFEKAAKLSSQIEEQLTPHSDWEDIQSLIKMNSAFQHELSLVKEHQAKSFGYLLETKKGKKRIYFAVSTEILKAIDFCEINNIQLVWLKDFLLPNGQISEHLDKYYEYAELVSIPIPTNDTEDKKWLLKLKETLQRSLFSNEKVEKKNSDEFNKKRTKFYSDIRDSHNELYSYLHNQENTKLK